MQRTTTTTKWRELFTKAVREGVQVRQLGRMIY